MKPTLVAALLLSLVTFAPAHAADQPAMAAAQPTCGQMTAGMAAISSDFPSGKIRAQRYCHERHEWIEDPAVCRGCRENAEEG